ncbi:hypothetical protein HYW58_01620 [Candidatus Kaiserbacteria bacterium]|nr:hypothetical protein [Candidatus Kaiserbacteria bacterium]
MYRHPLFITWFSLLVLIALLHAAALEFFFYWTYDWLDILVHFLGGMFISLSALWFFFESGYVNLKKSVRNVFLASIGAIIIIGIGWEIFEVLAGIPMEDNYALDTAIDMVMDILGALVASYAYLRVYTKKHEPDSYQ